MSCSNSLDHFSKLSPDSVESCDSIASLIDHTFSAYNGARLREAVQLATQKMLPKDGLVGWTLTGALTPAGLGKSCLVPLMNAGFIDWIVSTGANLYHDIHFGLKMSLHQGSPFLDDIELRKNEVVRIYDVLFDYSVLLDTDAYIRDVIQLPEFQRTMGSDEFHYLLGKYLFERAKALGVEDHSVLCCAYQNSIPIFTSSPGDSSIGMNLAAMELQGSKLSINVNSDVNASASLVYNAKKNNTKSSVIILGGGSPKNFILQTEPQIQEVMGLEEDGHDYFVQITDARPDTGGLSGATPSEAVSWGKVSPDTLPDCVVCYTDSTIALPLITSYLLEKAPKRNPKRLFDQRESILSKLKNDYLSRVPARNSH